MKGEWCREKKCGLLQGRISAMTTQLGQSVPYNRIPCAINWDHKLGFLSLNTSRTQAIPKSRLWLPKTKDKN
jgi:hypothetical protein